MIDESKRLAPPKETKGDLAHKAVSSIIGEIPWVGGLASELFTSIFAPPLERRLEAWRESVGRILHELQNRNVSLNELQRNEEFLDTVLAATHIALRSSQEEKLTALRNAIRNSALESAPEFAERQMFLSLIDRFTVWHLRLLALLADPIAWYERNGLSKPNISIGGSLRTILEGAFPELKGREEFYRQVWQEVYSAGLTGTNALNTMMTGGGLWEKRATERGQKFLAFIEDPQRI